MPPDPRPESAPEIQNKKVKSRKSTSQWPVSAEKKLAATDQGTPASVLAHLADNTNFLSGKQASLAGLSQSNADIHFDTAELRANETPLQLLLNGRLSNGYLGQSKFEARIRVDDYVNIHGKVDIEFKDKVSVTDFLIPVLGTPHDRAWGAVRPLAKSFCNDLQNPTLAVSQALYQATHHNVQRARPTAEHASILNHIVGQTGVFKSAGVDFFRGEQASLAGLLPANADVHFYAAEFRANQTPLLLILSGGLSNDYCDESKFEVSSKFDIKSGLRNIDIEFKDVFSAPKFVSTVLGDRRDYVWSVARPLVERFHYDLQNPTTLVHLALFRARHVGSEKENVSYFEKEPGFAEGFIPVWGSMRESIYRFHQGEYFWGVLYAADAASDCILVGGLLKSGVKIVWRGGKQLIKHEVKKTIPIFNIASQKGVEVSKSLAYKVPQKVAEEASKKGAFARGMMGLAPFLGSGKQLTGGISAIIIDPKSLRNYPKTLLGIAGFVTDSESASNNLLRFVIEESRDPKKEGVAENFQSIEQTSSSELEHSVTAKKCYIIQLGEKGFLGAYIFDSIVAAQEGAEWLAVAIRQIFPSADSSGRVEWIRMFEIPKGTKCLLGGDLRGVEVDGLNIKLSDVEPQVLLGLTTELKEVGKPVQIFGC